MPLPEGAAILAALLLAVVDLAQTSFIAVGLSQVLVVPRELPKVTSVVHELRAAARVGMPQGSAAPAGRVWRTVDNLPELRAGLEIALGRIESGIPDEGCARAVTIAKGLAEQSRDAVMQLRALRYRAERELGRGIRAAGDDLDVLGDVVELGIAANRARDFAREANREGLWLWRTDKDAYHAHRRLLDPTLPERQSATNGLDRGWLSAFDAGVRQCQAMLTLLGDEVEQFHRLLEAGSTISVARDAKAQEHFNFVATVGAVLLGLPSLVLAVYGAGGVETDFHSFGWLAPLAGCGLVSLILAVALPTATRAERRKRGIWSVAGVLVSLATLWVAVVVSQGS